MPKSLSQRSHALSQPKPSHRKRPHETTSSRYLKHPTQQPRSPPSTIHRQGPTRQEAAPIADKDRWIEDISEPSFQASPHDHGPSIIVEDDDSPVGNIFCFAAFADKHTGVLYNDLTGLFPYMSLEGNVCYLIVYHYESNAILGLPISGFDDNTVLQRTKHSSNFWKAKDTR